MSGKHLKTKIKSTMDRLFKVFSANPHKSLLISLSIITILISIPILSNIKQQQNSNAATPQVDRIFPTVGTPAGGDKVVIEGKNFILDSGVKQIGTGNYHNCILTYNNQVYCWGLNNLGQLGNNSTTNSYAPAVISQGSMSADTRSSMVATGAYNTCAVAFNNKIYC